MPDNSQAIHQLEQLLNGATTSVSVDGLSTSFSLDDARRRLQELRATDTSSIATNMVKPTVVRHSLRRAW